MPSSLPQSGIFLFGMERSGTTLLSMLVGAHPEIAVPLATAGLWYTFNDQLDAYENLATNRDLDRLVADLRAHDRIRRWDETLSSDEILPLCRPGDYASVIAGFHMAYAQRKGKPRWANLDIATLDRLHRAHELFPHAKFIHIYRDARDVALSTQTMPYRTGNLAECADAWSRRLTMNFCMGRMLGPDRYLAVAYEDLVNMPEATLSRICAFVGVSYTPRMLAYAEEAAAKVPVDRRWLWPNLDGSLDRSATQRWRTGMSKTKRIVVERYTAPLLRELGYETYAHLPRSAAAEILDLAYFLDRGQRGRRLLKTVGLQRKSVLERRWQGQLERAAP